MHSIPTYFGIAVGGRSHPEYAVWITENGFSVVKDGREEDPYFLICEGSEKKWSCTCPSFVYRGYCKHPGIVHDILKDAVLGGRLK